MFIERDGKRGKEPQYLICYPSLTDVGDFSILVDNLRAIAAGEVDVEPTIYYSAAGSTEFVEVECKTSSIDGKPDRRSTRVKTLQGDVVHELEWGIGSGSKKASKSFVKKPWRPKVTFHLLAEVFPLPEGERRFTPIGVFFKLQKAKDWAESVTKDYEASPDYDADDVLSFEWVRDKKTRELSLKAARNGVSVGLVQFVILDISLDPPKRDTYNEVMRVAADRARAEGREGEARNIEASMKGPRRVSRDLYR